MKVLHASFKTSTKFEDLSVDNRSILATVKLHSDEEMDKFINAMKDDKGLREIVNVSKEEINALYPFDRPKVYVSRGMPALSDIYEAGQETDYEHSPFIDIMIYTKEAWEAFAKFFKGYIIKNKYITSPI